MCNLDKLIQEKIEEFDTLSLAIAIALDEGDNEAAVRIRTEQLDFFKQSLKDIAYKSIEAVRVKEEPETCNACDRDINVQCGHNAYNKLNQEFTEKEKEFKGRE